MTAGERYLELVLRLGRLAPELIDSYAGPRALAERVGGEALVERCYTEGLALCGAFAIRVPDGYARLLREPFTTTDLRSRVGT